MTYFRFFFVDGMNRVVEPAEGIFLDDEMAAAHAQSQLQASHHAGVEVWQGGRLVRRLTRREPVFVTD
jgi:hypothetical protein